MIKQVLKGMSLKSICCFRREVSRVFFEFWLCGLMARKITAPRSNGILKREKPGGRRSNANLASGNIPEN